MFNKEIERKIIEFIKKSPIGVSSTEIAKYLDINRITLSKYLDVIREKTLIDFKRLGMAKLWYIPVNFNKEIFFLETTLEIARNLSEEDANELFNKAGSAIGKKIFTLYADFYGVTQLTVDQFVETVTDVFSKMEADFRVLKKSVEMVTFRNTKSPFGKAIKSLPSLSVLTSSILGTLAVKSFGYAKVAMRKSLDKDEEDYAIVYLKKTQDSEKEKATDHMSTD